MKTWTNWGKYRLLQESSERASTPNWAQLAVWPSWREAGEWSQRRGLHLLRELGSKWTGRHSAWTDQSGWCGRYLLSFWWSTSELPFYFWRSPHFAHGHRSQAPSPTTKARTRSSLSHRQQGVGTQSSTDESDGLFLGFLNVEDDQILSHIWIPSSDRTEKYRGGESCGEAFTRQC